MSKLLKVALDNKRYDLAAHIVVFGLIKAKFDERKKQEKRQQTRILQSGS
jgi:hypothetical protein